MNRDLYRRYRFFKANAGGVVGEAAKGAYALACAEMRAETINDEYEASLPRFTVWGTPTERIRCEWSEDDDYGYSLGDHAYWCSTERMELATEPYTSPHTHDVQVCILNVDGEVAESLGGIIDPSDDYKRVVCAELMLEHFTNPT